MAQWVKNPPVMQEMLETWVWSLDWEDPLEEGMATHSSILAWRIPWTEEPGALWSTGSQRVGHDWSYLACTRACVEMVEVVLTCDGGIDGAMVVVMFSSHMTRSDQWVVSGRMRVISHVYRVEFPFPIRFNLDKSLIYWQCSSQRLSSISFLCSNDGKSRC